MFNVNVSFIALSFALQIMLSCSERVAGEGEILQGNERKCFLAVSLFVETCFRSDPCFTYLVRYKACTYMKISGLR